MNELLPPVTVVSRGMRTLIVHAGTPQGPPLMEILPYSPDRPAVTIGAVIASRLNWHPQIVEVLRAVIRAWALNPKAATKEQTDAAIGAHNMLKAIEGKK